MDFEQISIDSIESTPIQELTFNHLPNDSRIYCKLDWLTVMFCDCSIRHVLEWLNMSVFVSDFAENIIETVRGYDDVFRFSCNGVNLEVSQYHFYQSMMDSTLFDLIVPKIKCEMTGSGLDFLRSIGVNMDLHRFEAPALPDGGTYHFTRCDFAFDFINYCPEFIDNMLDYVRLNALPSGRVPIYGLTSGISCRVVTGNQKTIYFGSPQADRMLRCYDKRLESCDPESGVYVKSNPYQNPDSWFRIEWQTRNRFANSLCMDPSFDLRSVLKMVFEKYNFADGTDKRDRHRQPVDFWLNLLPWNEIESRIVQNANFVQFREYEQVLVDSIEKTQIGRFMIYITLQGLDGFENACNKYLGSLFEHDPRSIRRLYSFNSKVNQCKTVTEKLQLGKGQASGGLYIGEDNKYHFKF